jgi:hypothetical protein
MPAPVRAHVPEIPDALEYIVMRAIAKHPDHRQPTMSHVARELEQFLGTDVSVPPVAIGSSVVPAALSGAALPIPLSPIPAAQDGAATTTASVVMRQRGGVPPDRDAAPRPNDSPLPQPGHPRPDLARKRFVPSPLIFRTLVGAATLAGGAGLIVAIATRQSPPSPSAAARSAEMAPASPPSAAPPALEEPLAAAEPIETTPLEIAADPPAGSTPAPPPPSAAAEVTGNFIRIKIANPRPGLRATVDGRATSLPVRLPRDNKVHVLSFTAPNFKPETKTVVADQDRALTLEYHPKLYVP